jgi:hypothetical protein
MMAVEISRGDSRSFLLARTWERSWMNTSEFPLKEGFSWIDVSKVLNASIFANVGAHNAGESRNSQRGIAGGARVDRLG